MTAAPPKKKTRLDESNEHLAYVEGRNAAIEGGGTKYDGLAIWQYEGLVEHFIRGYAEIRLKSPEEDDDD
jgi:hypothetical protein